jgi:hypothetical protein
MAVVLFRDYYARAPVQLTQPYAGVKPMLQRFNASGLALGVCTNKPKAFAATILRYMSATARSTPRLPFEPEFHSRCSRADIFAGRSMPSNRCIASITSTIFQTTYFGRSAEHEHGGARLPAVLSLSNRRHISAKPL